MEGGHPRRDEPGGGRRRRPVRGSRATPPAITVLLEHDEDMARLSGVLRSTRSARRASEEPVRRRIAHRLPWLVLGLLGALAAAGIVSSHERDLESTITLAFFCPASSTWPTPSAPRPRPGHPWPLGGRGDPGDRRRAPHRPGGRRRDRRRLPPDRGGRLGRCRCGDRGGPGALRRLLHGDADRHAAALAVQPRGADPAFGSGPLATVVQDLLSLLIYFAVARSWSAEGCDDWCSLVTLARRRARAGNSCSAVPPARGRARCRRS